VFLRARVDDVGTDPQHGGLAEEFAEGLLRELAVLQARPLRLGDRLVRQVDDVGRAPDPVALEPQVPGDEVRDDEAPVAAQMGHEVDRGP